MPKRAVTTSIIRAPIGNENSALDRRDVEAICRIDDAKKQRTRKSTENFLIEQMCEFRCLWDINHREYVDATCVRIAWLEIGRRLQLCAIDVDKRLKLFTNDTKNNSQPILHTSTNGHTTDNKTNQQHSSSNTLPDDGKVGDDDDAIVPNIDPDGGGTLLLPTINDLLYSYMHNIETVRRRLIAHRRRQQLLLAQQFNDSIEYQGSNDDDAPSRKRRRPSLANTPISIRWSPFYEVLVDHTRFMLPKRYHLQEKIANGRDGVVWSASDSVDERNVAVKKVSRPFDGVDRARRAYRELKLLTVLKHKNIIRLLNVYTPHASSAQFADMYLITELMDGDLAQVIADDARLDHATIASLLYQLLCAIRQLHRANLIHRNLKPSNIGVNCDATLRIVDFGYAHASSINMTQSHFKPPEVILGMNDTNKVDIWAIGCIFAEFFIKKHLFDAVSDIDQLRQMVDRLGAPNSKFIDQQSSPILSEIFSKAAPNRCADEIFPIDIFPSDDASNLSANAFNARDLLLKMLQIDPNERIDINAAIDHPYLRHLKNADDFEERNNPMLPIDCLSLVEGDETKHPDEWKALIFNDIKLYESTHDIVGDDDDEEADE